AAGRYPVCADGANLCNFAEQRKFCVPQNWIPACAGMTTLRVAWYNYHPPHATKVAWGGICAVDLFRDKKPDFDMGVGFGAHIPKQKNTAINRKMRQGVRKISCSMTPRALSDTAAPRRLTVMGYIVRDKNLHL
ncbi:MAG: hypothetical protein II843_01565, partial [Alphaproteobacteria bacterium]|nr:hypothetical protein [Alphaproteobacteria bacterium]